MSGDIEWEVDWDDYNQVLKIVKNNGWDLEYASKRLQDNKKIVLEAIKHNGWILGYASHRLKDNEAIILKAVKEDGWALLYASDRIRSDKKFMLRLLMLFKNDKEKINDIKLAINENLKKELNL